MWLAKKIRVIILTTGDIEWSNSGMPHHPTMRNFTHQGWAIWDLCNHDLLGLIPDPGHIKRVTLSVESSHRIPFYAGTGCVKTPEWGKHHSNSRMPCLVIIFGTWHGTGVHPSNYQSVLFRCPVDLSLNITNCERWWPGMVNAQKTCLLSVVGCTYDCHNPRCGRKMILHIRPPETQIHFPA